MVAAILDPGAVRLDQAPHELGDRLTRNLATLDPNHSVRAAVEGVIGATMAQVRIAGHLDIPDPAGVLLEALWPEDEFPDEDGFTDEDDQTPGPTGTPGRIGDLQINLGVALAGCPLMVRGQLRNVPIQWFEHQDGVVLALGDDTTELSGWLTTGLDTSTMAQLGDNLVGVLARIDPKVGVMQVDQVEVNQVDTHRVQLTAFGRWGGRIRRPRLRAHGDLVVDRAGIRVESPQLKTRNLWLWPVLAVLNRFIKPAELMQIDDSWRARLRDLHVSAGPQLQVDAVFG